MSVEDEVNALSAHSVCDSFERTTASTPRAAESRFHRLPEPAPRIPVQRLKVLRSRTTALFSLRACRVFTVFTVLDLTLQPERA